MELIIDFETVDRHLEELGSGWVYGTMKVLGAGVMVDDNTPYWIENNEKGHQDIIDLANRADVIVAHNLQYDVGILYSWGVDLKNKILLDTIILAKLTDNSLKSYSLDALSQKFFGLKKTQEDLGQYIIDNQLYMDSTGKSIKIDATKNGALAKATKYAYANMDIIYEKDPQVVIEYCLQDISLTKSLFEHFNKPEIKTWAEKFSSLFKVILKNRARGVRISLEKLQDVRQALLELEEKHRTAAAVLYGDLNFNPNSPKQLTLAYEKRSDVPRTPKGNISVTKQWLETQTDPLSLEIKKYRHYLKARRDFCDSVMECQALMPEHRRGRVYPEYNIHGARTGRFSCKCPNIQQIPGRDDELCDLIRGMYIPEDGENWYSLDFSQQEFRIFSHFAFVKNDDTLVSSQFIRNPNTDFYEFVAKLCNLKRDDAKPISLGKLYGMGAGKLSVSLKRSIDDARKIIKQYDYKFPSAKELAQGLSKDYKQQFYVKTLGGRKLKVENELDEPGGDYSYRAINYCIQGTAAEEIIDAWIALDTHGLNVVISVHDEMNFSLSSEQEAEKAKEIMESQCRLVVPMVCEIGGGTSWAEAKRDAKRRKKEAKHENVHR